MGFLKETTKEILDGAVNRLKLCYAQEVKSSRKLNNRYKRGFSSAIQALIKISNEFVSRAEGLDKQEEEGRKQIQGKVNEAATLARDFLLLPYHETAAIAQELGLYEQTDSSLSDHERHKQIFTRAKEKGVLLALRVAVTKRLEEIEKKRKERDDAPEQESEREEEAHPAPEGNAEEGSKASNGQEVRKEEVDDNI